MGVGDGELVVIEAASRSHIAPSEVIRFDFRLYFFIYFFRQTEDKVASSSQSGGGSQEGRKYENEVARASEEAVCFPRRRRCLFGTVGGFYSSRGD